jgi:hypothetical protein
MCHVASFSKFVEDNRMDSEDEGVLEEANALIGHLKG